MPVSKSQTAAVAAKREALLNMLKSDPELLASLLSAAGATKEAKVPAKQEKAEKTEKAAPKSREERLAENQKYFGKIVKLTKGKYKGQTAKVFFVSKGKWSMRGEYASGIDFVAPRDCEIVGDMSKADLDRLVSADKAEREETIYVDAVVVGEGDKAVKLSHSGWNSRPFFYKANGEKPSQIVKTGFTTSDGLDIFEIPVWKVRSECGLDSLNALKARQPMLEACFKKKAAK